MRHPFLLGTACLSLLLTGCSTIGSAVDAINPFAASAPKIQPAELTPIETRAQMHSLWQQQIANAGEFIFSPAVVGKSVYAAARDGTLARFDDGRQVWRVNAGKPLSGGVGASDTLVVVGTTEGDVLAFHASDGKPAWQARVSSEVLAAPVVSGDLVAVRSNDARIFGFEAADGKRRWIYQRAMPTLSLRSNAGVIATDRALYAGFPGGRLVAIARNNGAALWEATVAIPRGATELERIADVVGDPVIAGGTICAVAYLGRIACFDRATGRQIWARSLSSLTGLDIGGRHVYASDDKGGLHAFDRDTGAILWKQDKLFMRQPSRPVAIGTRLAVADFQGVVHLLSGDDGAFLARLNTDGSAVLAPPRPYPGGFLVQTKSGNLHALSIR